MTRRPSPNRPAPNLPTRWLYYTSGSTSDPKGAWHTDPSVIAGMNTWLDKLRPTSDDVYPVAFPAAHIGGVCMLGVALATGMRLLLIEAFDTERSPLVMAERGATLLGSALPFFRAYLAAQAAHGTEPLFPRLRACVSGGAPKPPGLHEEIKRELGGVGVIGSWGLTEFPIATSGAMHDTDEQMSATEGAPGPGVEIRVVGLDGLDTPSGEEGELRLRGPQMFLGYANPALDADALDEQGYFRTGDLGVVAPTGHVTITGRLKDIIIRNAENIAASEIEDALHLHPAIADVAVIGLPDPRTGERAVRGRRTGQGRDVAVTRRDRRALPRARPREAEGARAAGDRRRGPPQRHGQDPEARPPQAILPLEPGNLRRRRPLEGRLATQVRHWEGSMRTLPVAVRSSIDCRARHVSPSG